MALLIHNTTVKQESPLGAELLIGTDRVFRYAKNGPEALRVGTVVQGPPANDTHSNLACVAASVGAQTVTLTFDRAGSLRLDEYKDGYLYINDADGEGYLYDIKGHPSGDRSYLDNLSGTPTVVAIALEDVTWKFQLKDGLAVALTTSSQATLTPNPYLGVSRPFGDTGDLLVGVTPVAVGANEHFWCQVRGPAIVTQEGALFAGRGVMASQEKPGAVAVAKQVVPVVTGSRGVTSLVGGADVGPSIPGAQPEYSQKALVRRLGGSGKFADAELLEEISGKATIPNRVIGYCINPRVSTEHALVYLTLS